MKLDEDTQRLVGQAVAAGILGTLDGPKRDEIFAKGVADALTGYDIKRAYEKAVTDRAMELVISVLAEGKYDEQIRAGLRKGLDSVVAVLPEAMEQTIIAAIAGKPRGSGYNDQSPGLLLGYLSDATMKARKSLEEPKKDEDD